MIEKSIFKFLSVVLFLTGAACFNTTNKPEIRKAKFDNELIELLPAYQKLCSFLEDNFDELVTFRNSKYQDYLLRKDMHSNRMQFYDCRRNVRSFSKFTIPDDLEEELFSLINSVNMDNILAYNLCYDGAIEITMKADHVGFVDNWKYTQYHSLEYKTNRDLSKYPSKILKDTLLSSEFRYFIYLSSS